MGEVLSDSECRVGLLGAVAPCPPACLPALWLGSIHLTPPPAALRPTAPPRPQGGIYTLPSHLSPGARDLIPRMLLVDPLKRITIPEIRCGWAGGPGGAGFGGQEGVLGRADWRIGGRFRRGGTGGLRTCSTDSRAPPPPLPSLQTGRPAAGSTPGSRCTCRATWRSCRWAHPSWMYTAIQRRLCCPLPPACPSSFSEHFLPACPAHPPPRPPTCPPSSPAGGPCGRGGAGGRGDHSRGGASGLQPRLCRRLAQGAPAKQGARAAGGAGQGGWM